MELYNLYNKLKRTDHRIEPNQLKHMRKSMYNMTQVQFADLIGVAYYTYITWEQGRYYPSSPAQALLHIVCNHKDIFLKERKKLFKKIGEIKY